ncbi:MAG: hypothetical protein HY264_06140 [Chloroflexi bacterium]|nr:hypothetical protein [Chloroflexota bacterium]
MTTFVAVTLPSGLAVPITVTVEPVAMSLRAFVVEVTSVTLVVGVRSTRRCAPAAVVIVIWSAETEPTLLASDVAAEGLNLQRAGRIVHYDLPWTAVRLEQRDGRALRQGEGSDGPRRPSNGRASSGSSKGQRVPAVRTGRSWQCLQDAGPGSRAGMSRRSPTRSEARRSAAARRPGGPGRGRRRDRRRSSR